MNDGTSGIQMFAWLSSTSAVQEFGHNHDNNSYRVLRCLFFATFLSLISSADPVLQGVTDACTNLAALLAPIHHSSKQRIFQASLS